MRFHLCAIYGAFSLIATSAGCVSAPLLLQAPKAVFGVELTPYARTEECIPLEPGARIGFRFEASNPVAFNVHFREDNVVITPLTRDNATSESGDFSADRKQIYCLMWEAGAKGSVLDYRVSPWKTPQ